MYVVLKFKFIIYLYVEIFLKIFPQKYLIRYKLFKNDTGYFRQRNQFFALLGFASRHAIFRF
jgi:hypothetical protein